MGHVKAMDGWGVSGGLFMSIYPIHQPTGSSIIDKEGTHPPPPAPLASLPAASVPYHRMNGRILSRQSVHQRNATVTESPELKKNPPASHPTRPPRPAATAARLPLALPLLLPAPALLVSAVRRRECSGSRRRRPWPDGRSGRGAGRLCRVVV